MANNSSVKLSVDDWHFNQPPANRIDKTLLLRTIMGIAVPGIWQGKIGEHFSAWCELKET